MKKLTVDSQKLIFYDMQLNQLVKTRVEESLVRRKFSFLWLAQSFNLKILLLKNIYPVWFQASLIVLWGW